MLRQKFLTFTALAGAAALIAMPVSAQDLTTYDDEDPIVLSGTVQDINGDEFTLNYGTGYVTVEMDDWDWFFNEAEALIPGERVTVSGWVDDDLFEGREIKAETVYVGDRSTYYYGDIRNQPDYYVYSYTSAAPEGNWVSMSGRIQNIAGDEFTLENQSGEITVETDEMAYNPLDDEGFQKLRKGDRVYVSGILDDDFFERRAIEANTIVSLRSEERAQKNNMQNQNTQPANEATGGQGRM